VKLTDDVGVRLAVAGTGTVRVAEAKPALMIEKGATPTAVAWPLLLMDTTKVKVWPRDTAAGVRLIADTLSSGPVCTVTVRPLVAELIKPEVADRLAIRELVDAYAYCADRRDAAGQMALFTEDTDFVVYMDSSDPTPTQHLRGRAALAPVFDALNAYQTAMHFNGQCTTVLDGDRASGVAYCLAHHVKVDGSTRSLMVAAIRYLDTYVKQDGIWLFAERKLMVDWTDTRVSVP